MYDMLCTVGNVIIFWSRFKVVKFFLTLTIINLHSLASRCVARHEAIPQIRGPESVKEPLPRSSAVRQESRHTCAGNWLQ